MDINIIYRKLCADFQNWFVKRDVKSFRLISKIRMLNACLCSSYCILASLWIYSLKFMCNFNSFDWIEWLALTNHRRPSQNHPTDAIRYEITRRSNSRDKNGTSEHHTHRAHCLQIKLFAYICQEIGMDGVERGVF